jgi:hypothetical protein
MKTAKSKRSKGEAELDKMMTDITGIEYTKGRYKFLINPKTGRPLELDGYNKPSNLAYEYDGQQHYHSNSYFNREHPNKFKEQVYRDYIKNVSKIIQL